MRINQIIKEDAGQIADVAAMAAVAGMAYPIMLAMVKGAFKTGRGLLKLRKIAQKAGVKLADKLGAVEPLEEDWFDIYKKYTGIDDALKGNLKDIHNNWNMQDFDPDSEADVEKFIQGQADHNPEYLDYFAKLAGKHIDTPNWQAQIAYDVSPSVRDGMLKRGITRDEVPKLFNLRDKIKTDHPEAYELIKQGKGTEAWKLISQQ